ncbi:Ger(x)C family spore germination protein [Paenibacillus sp. GCM10023252]|uniref:Ger(x)C family spore germination protein n=1 Tax=Paenibacillus sp. GCM10023252 TaxID=3252649 RepID=UPI003613A28D
MNRLAGKLCLMAGMLLLTSCATTTDKKVLDDQALAIAMSFDQGHAKKLDIVAGVPNPIKETEEKLEVIHVSAQGVTEGWDLLRRKAGRYVVPGQLRLILIEEQLARSGMESILNPLYRDPNVNTGILLAVTKGKAGPYVEARYKDKSISPVYLYGLISREERITDPNFGRLGNMVRELHTSGLDITVPLLKRSSTDMSAEGLAIIQQGKMVGSVSKSDFPYYYLLKGVSYNDIITMMLRPDDEGAVSLSFSKNRREIILDPKHPHLAHMNIFLQGQLLENKDYPVNTQQEVDALTAVMEQELKEHCQQLLSKLQAMSADPLGIGRYYYARLHPADWSDEWWMNEFKKMRFELEVQVRVTRTGVLK